MLKGKSAVVTGSTSGIGLGIAHALAKEGVNIMLNGFTDETTVAKLKNEIVAMGVKVEFSGADVGKIDQVETMIDEAVRAFGSVDIIVNNAGITHISPVEDFPLDKWDAVMATNLFSVFYATRKALPIMRHKGWGRIINIASVHGHVASVNKIAYIAAKHGVVGMTKATALETAGSGVTCNAICPGWVLTPLVQGQIDIIAKRDGLTNEEASTKLLSEKQPSKQFVTTEDVGALAVFLCSDSANQITGASYTIDGGWTAV